MKKELKVIKQTEFTFSLNNFEGPLDLLLHLAKTNEIEITDINLNELIDQYILIIKQAQQYSIDVSSAYIEMAAELIRLKSQSILPTIGDDEEYLDQLEELNIDREELISRLLEYKKYKEVTAELDELQENRHNFFTRTPDKLTEYRNKSYQESLSLEEFASATKKFLQTIEDKKNETQILSVQEITIEQNMDFLNTLTTSFSLFDKFRELNVTNRLNLFLAILEALKLQYITFKQEPEDIIIYPFKETNEL